MPYSTKYNEEKHSIVEKYLEKFNVLSHPKPLLIQTSSLEGAKRLTWLFHDYFHLIGATPIYSVKQIMSHVVLSKGKPTLSLATSLRRGEEEQNFSKEFFTIIENLLSSPLPREYLSSLVKDENISFGTLAAVAAEYSRVMES